MEELRWTFQFERGPAGGKFKYDQLFGCGRSCWAGHLPGIRAGLAVDGYR